MVELTDRQLKEMVDREVERRLKDTIHLWKKNAPYVEPLMMDLVQVGILTFEMIKLEPENPRWPKLIKDAEKFAIGEVLRRGTLVSKEGSKISGVLKTHFKKHYLIHDTYPYTPGPSCAVCGMPIETLKSKYCSSKCRLSAYYARRNSAKGIQKKIGIHTHCLICGKSIEGKRAGTKTCSMSCRKTLSLRKKVISS